MCIHIYRFHNISLPQRKNTAIFRRIIKDIYVKSTIYNIDVIKHRISKCDHVITGDFLRYYDTYDAVRYEYNTT